MESQLWIFRRTDCLRPPKRQHLPNLRHTWRRSSFSLLLLDTSAANGHNRTAHCRRCKRPHLEPSRTSPALPSYRRSHRRHSHVPSTQCRLLWPHRIGSNDIRIRLTDVSRHIHQHGHAAFQDACGRPGQRTPERPCLLHTELSMQRRQPRRIPRANHTDSNRHLQPRA